MQGNKAYQAPQFIPQTSPKAASAAQFTPTAGAGAGAGPHQFMPQAPGLGGFSSMGHPQQPQAPAAPPKPAAPPTPTGPPANVNITNVDTSKVHCFGAMILQSLASSNNCQTSLAKQNPATFPRLHSYVREPLSRVGAAIQQQCPGKAWKSLSRDQVKPGLVLGGR